MNEMGVDVRMNEVVVVVVVGQGYHILKLKNEDTIILTAIDSMLRLVYCLKPQHAQS
jgi:hypothetical protein